MRILILTQWYPPEPALLLQELAQTLQEAGHDVTVLTGFPNYPSGNLYDGYHLRLWMKEVLNGVKLVRVALFPDHGTSKIKRILNYLSFAISAALQGYFLISRPDIIFVYHPPLTVGLPAVVLGRLWKVPFVYQIQDMWPETLSATEMLQNKRLLRWIGVFAKWIYRQAERILVISPGFKANLIYKGVPDSKIYVISNWADQELYYPAKPDAGTARNLQLANRFNIVFAGNIGKAQGLETVIRAASLLSSEKNIQFVFVGDGIDLPRLKEAVRELRLSNVKFLGRFPATEMSRLFALADVLLVHLNDDPLFRITIPHKILSYLAVGKPVLAALHGDGANVIREARAGLTCPPDNPTALANTVQVFYTLPLNERLAMGERALLTAQTQYNRRLLVAKIEKILLNALN